MFVKNKSKGLEKMLMSQKTLKKIELMVYWSQETTQRTKWYINIHKKLSLFVIQ